MFRSIFMLEGWTFKGDWGDLISEYINIVCQFVRLVIITFKKIDAHAPQGTVQPPAKH